MKNDVEYKDGKLFWKTSNNQHPVGQEVGSEQPDAYSRFTYKGKHWLLHRAIFYYHNGYLPKYVDHINGDRSDNRIENLRPATASQNCYNQKGKGTKTLPKNVFAKCGKYFVALRLKGKLVRFGTYADLELADLVATEARDLYHGAYARHA